VDATLKIEKDVDQRARIAVIDGSGGTALGRRSFEIFVADLAITGHFRPKRNTAEESSERRLSIRRYGRGSISSSFGLRKKREE
jgi:hypothetical protein